MTCVGGRFSKLFASIGDAIQSPHAASLISALDQLADHREKGSATDHSESNSPETIVLSSDLPMAHLCTAPYSDTAPQHASGQARLQLTT